MCIFVEIIRSFFVRRVTLNWYSSSLIPSINRFWLSPFPPVRSAKWSSVQRFHWLNFNPSFLLVFLFSLKWFIFFGGRKTFSTLSFSGHFSSLCFFYKSQKKSFRTVEKWKIQNYWSNFTLYVFVCCKLHNFSGWLSCRVVELLTSGMWKSEREKKRESKIFFRIV